MFLLSGCGGSSSETQLPAATPTPAPTPSPSPSPAIPIAIQPFEVTVAPLAQTQFVGTGDGTLLWSVDEGASGGTVSDTGLYTAPALAGRYHVVARSAANTLRFATATVTVPVVVTVSPTEATTVAEPVTFTASVNAANTAVTWSIQEGVTGGTITQDGVYTPPRLGGIFHIIATSVADGTTQGVATVNVPLGGADGVVE